DKKAEVETDGLVTPDEKAAVDGMNDTTTAKKEKASQLVDALPEGPVKDSLKARLDQVVTSEVTVNDADSNSTATDVDAADNGAEQAVKAVATRRSSELDKKAEVETDGLVTPDEKAAVDGMNDTTTAKKEKASQLVDALPEGPVKDSLKARLDQVVTSEV